ncbi:hypothetical protein ACIPPS_14545 [Streptomyces sp. NPDC090127]|uniref:hypothetical protein n=1 Tax=Streptomyces sp. NPDC090127 TaxID=3365953 RepID=UPI0038051A1C
MFAAACVLLTATGHVLMSDASVPWWALAAAFAATGGAAWWLAGRERGPVAVTVAALVTQSALHTCFSLAQASGATLGDDHMAHATMGSATSVGHHSMGPDPTGAAAMGFAPMGPDPTGAAAMGFTPMVSDPMGADPMSGHVMADMSPGGMLAAHLLAALLCGLWLAHGERAAFRVLRALAALLLAPLRLILRLPAPPHRPRIRARRAERARRLRRLLLAHVLTSRGPPPAAAAL